MHKKFKIKQKHRFMNIYTNIKSGELEVRHVERQYKTKSSLPGDQDNN